MNCVFSLLVSIFFCCNLFAHGMDHPGPNGGAVKMPGPFHTEVIASEDGSIMVFLLDIEIKNPIVANSSVSGEIRNGNKVTKLSCPPMGGNHFHCQAPKASAELYKQGKLYLLAKRGEFSGESIYELPIKIPEVAKPEETHSHH